MIYRVEVAERAGVGSERRGASHELVGRIKALLNVEARSVHVTRIYLIDSPDSLDRVAAAARQLLADPVTEVLAVTGSGSEPQADDAGRIEVHPKPGVMDPVAASATDALRDLGLTVSQVRTGRGYLIRPALSRAQLELIGRSALANAVIEDIFFEPFLPARFAQPEDQPQCVRSVVIRDLDEAALKRLSREGHLFLSVPEMQAVQAYFRAQKREPTDVELETIAQTWSEHCVHKTLKSGVEVTEVDEGGAVVGRRQYGNLIRDTIFASTRTLMEGPAGQWCLSVFKDNAGVIALDDVDAVCMKVETHNHPSAIDPYGGSATGIGGCIRDVMGTGLGARPIAGTDVFCVAPPDHSVALPDGVIHPRRVLEQVVAGVRDYGNRMGIPTVNGAVYFDDRYLGNPLVFCGCVGLLPRDMTAKAARLGDAIVLVGGRTGRDGIHGATFSSAELTGTHAQEFGHAVQIGNAITQKKMMDVILAARDRRLFTGITDCGAGGLSSAVGEMGAETGATVELDRVPLKYAGLRYDEIWISEAQERMVLSVPAEHIEQLLNLARSEDVEATVIGQFAPAGELILRHGGAQVGRLLMEFLHDGLPMPTRAARVTRRAARSVAKVAADAGSIKERLLRRLADPNIASKHWIIRQYDHEVRGGTIIKPLVGPLQAGPSDAAVLWPKASSLRGVAIGCGMAPWIDDPYEMAVAAVDEAVRNVVAVGGDVARIALLDNFCWPSVDDDQTMGTLVRACEGCRDAALAYAMPFISGKDSLHNQFVDARTGRVIRIPRTLLISAIGVIADVRRCVTMDIKGAASRICLVRPIGHRDAPAELPGAAAVHRGVAGAIAAGLVTACHDISDGGLPVALAEMCIASGKGAAVDQELFGTEESGDDGLARYLLELADGTTADELRQRLGSGVDVVDIAAVHAGPELTLTSPGWPAIHISLAELTAAWRGTLDW